jgi:hypothetical protein
MLCGKVREQGYGKEPAQKKRTGFRLSREVGR